eukprot:scaffold4545_cov111-Isochrysis_galbana.AAC.18
MERTNLFADERDPNRVVRGVVRLSKNGEPINLFMPACGLLGDFGWLAEHLEHTASLGAALSRIGSGRGGADPTWPRRRASCKALRRTRARFERPSPTCWGCP